MSDPNADAYVGMRWRVGTSPATEGRTIYACPAGSTRRDGEVLIGQMDTGALALEAVSAHNAALDRLHMLTWCDRHPWRAWWRQVHRRPLGREAP